MCAKEIRDKKEADFLRRQRLYYESAPEVKRYYWQTTHPEISIKERELLQDIRWNGRGIFLEVGCGEGANLYHMLHMQGIFPYVGIDFSYHKIQFAKAQDKKSKSFFIQGNALQLPFKDSSVPNILCRDVFHHLDPMRDKLLAEMWRVLSKGGSLFIIETNYNCFINRLFSFVCPKERGLKNSTPARMMKLIVKIDPSVSLKMHRSLELHRVVYHYSYGFPFLKLRIFSKVLQLLENLITSILPEGFYSHMMIKLYKT